MASLQLPDAGITLVSLAIVFRTGKMNTMRFFLWLSLLLCVLLPGVGLSNAENFSIKVDSGDEYAGLELITFSRKTIGLISERFPPEALDDLSLEYLIRIGDSGAVPDTFFTFPREIVFRPDSKILRIFIDANWQQHQEALVRTLALGLVQAMAWKEKPQAPVAELPEPPLWLSEGLTQWTEQALQNEISSSVLIPVLKYRDLSIMAEPFRQIVWKAHLSNRAPDLNKVQEWNALPELRVERMWQQAFCYWAFEAATRTGSGRMSLVEWIHESDVITPEPYWRNSASEANWWNREIRLSETSSEFALSWQRTTQALRDLMVCKFTHAQTKDTELLRLGELPRLPASKSGKKSKNQELENQVRATVLEQVEGLLDLESRAHALCQPALAAYIESLRSWIGGDMEAYRQRFQEGQERMRLAGKYHSLINDKLDWVIVNYEFSSTGEDGLDYSQLVRELTRERERVRRATHMDAKK